METQNVASTRITVFSVAIALLAVLATSPANAGYGRVAESLMDGNALKIAEKEHLGNKLDGDIQLVDQDGNKFKLGELFGKPLILILSYYKCDGVCGTVNSDLKGVLEKAKRVQPGADYRVLTVSFDKFDTADSLSTFRGDLSLPSQMAKEWKHSLAINFDDVRKLTKSVGFRYFWSQADRTFFHPNVYIFISPDGRVVRYLYASGVGAHDIEVAVLEAAEGKISPSQLGNLVLSYCYSYNYKEGKYTISIPVFVGIGSLAIGGVSILVSSIIYKRRRNKQEVS